MCTVILTTVGRNNTRPINIDMLDKKRKEKTTNLIEFNGIIVLEYVLFIYEMFFPTLNN